MVAGESVRLPAAAERVWRWFWLLDRTRNGNGYSANRISYSDIRALAGDRPDEWELDAILAMDVVRLELTAAPAEFKEPLKPGMIAGG